MFIIPNLCHKVVVEVGGKVKGVGKGGELKAKKGSEVSPTKW